MIIKKINLNGKSYPQSLKEVYDAPKQLYVLGDEKILNEFGIAIVGTRKASEYGKNIATQFAYELAQKGIVIISGLAKGIDSYAHIGTLKAKGKTIAVLGHGLDMIYPAENRKLAEEIIRNGGCLISEYPVGVSAKKEHFPERNRIISGLSRGVLVVEAQEKSGSLITVDFALEQGRDVYGIPGNINSQNSVGTNELIKQGAKLVTSFQDIIYEYK